MSETYHSGRLMYYGLGSGDAAACPLSAAGLRNVWFRLVALSFHCRVSLGNSAAARGWLGRAARLVEEFGPALLVRLYLRVR